MTFSDKLLEQPIIGAIGTQDDIDELIQSPCEIFFILNGEISDLQRVVDQIIKTGKQVFVHIDLMSGLKGDAAGLRYIKQVIQPTGIISTKSHLIKEAKAMGLFVIQRLFLLDSINLEKGIQSINKNKPDAVEILPGSLHKITELIVKQTRCPVITGGLILDKEDVVSSIKSGAIGVSTSNRLLWSL